MSLAASNQTYINMINPKILYELQQLYQRSRLAAVAKEAVGLFPTENSVMSMDAVEYLSMFPDNSVDFVFTDDPYGAAKTRVNLKAREDITSDFKWDINVPMFLSIPWIYEAHRILKPGGALVNCGFPNFATMFMAVCMYAGFRWRTHRAWFKTNCAPHFRLNNWVSSYEVIWVAQKGDGKWKTFNFQEQRVMQNMVMQTVCLHCGCVYPAYESNGFDHPEWFKLVDWQDCERVDISGIRTTGTPIRDSLCPSCNKIHQIFSQENVQDANLLKAQYIAPLTGGQRQHPTKKPRWMATELVNILTNKGDIVVDPFCGEGTFVIEAARLGRVVYGNDLDPRWSKLADERVKEAARNQHHIQEVKRQPKEVDEEFNLFEILD